MAIYYRSVSDLNNLIVSNLSKFPHNTDLIVGIPRSGMLPANLLALYLNRPYTDIDSFIEGKIYGYGERGKNIDFGAIQNVLVVDDSIDQGGALKKAKHKLACLETKYSIKYAAIIASDFGKNLVDVYCAVIPETRFFQWNLFHHAYLLNKCCFDIDGVLCEDPVIDDDGPLYCEYISNATPKYIPTVTIDTLVTCRLEKYREITEIWLKKQNISYRKLIMLNMKTREERRAWNKHGEYKGNVFKSSGNILFIESSLEQARIIAKVAKKPVFCTENFSLISPDSGNESVLGKGFFHRMHILLWRVKVFFLSKFR